MVTAKSSQQKDRLKCRKKFLYYFPGGFSGKKYIEWERSYKKEASDQFQAKLNKTEFKKLLSAEKYSEIALTAVQIESRTNLLFSFEKMALRDAVKTKEGAKMFATGLYELLYGRKKLKDRFENFIKAVALLPRKQTRVLTWPLVTVFGFLGNPDEHIFLKPRVTQAAAEKYNFDFKYVSKPNWESYQNIIQFAEQIRTDINDLKPKDFIDLQSFIWVMGSEEYPD
jgi:hypothetical protein